LIFMKKFGSLLLSTAALALFLTFQNCGGSSEKTEKQVTEELLMSKTWVYSSVTTPDYTATIGTDWASFSVKFNGTSMVTTGHATGAGDVWPSTSYAVSDDGKNVNRGDDADMLITSKSETNLNVIFTVTGGKEIDGRLAALDGEYSFNLK
jgi:hypothetical protein